ncbi:MAG: flavin reductase family protein [Actinobacteria bacterium]|nr:flavin reductase family protein [Actinomycetota bacterium]
MSDHFRHVLSHVPTGVAVIAGIGGDGPAGLAVGSFTSISLDPPLVGFFCDRGSTSWPPIRESGGFCANVLAAGQGELAAHFAHKGGSKFDGLEWEPAPFTGSPVLEGTLAWLDCRLEREVELGDHSLVVGTPLELVVSGEGSPLVFFRGDYRG